MGLCRLALLNSANPATPHPILHPAGPCQSPLRGISRRRLTPDCCGRCRRDRPYLHCRGTAGGVRFSGGCRCAIVGRGRRHAVVQVPGGTRSHSGCRRCRAYVHRGGVRPCASRLHAVKHMPYGGSEWARSVQYGICHVLISSF